MDSRPGDVGTVGRSLPARPARCERAMPIAARRRQMALQCGRRVAVARMARLRSGRPIGGPPARIGAGRRIGIDRPPEANFPCALANLDLTETAGAQLGDKSRQQVLAQPADRSVILEALGEPARIGSTGLGGGAGRTGGQAAGAGVPDGH